MITMNDLKKYTEELSKKITFNTENVYEHTLSLRGGSAYNKFVATIYTNSAIPMISSDIQKYVRDNASSAGSSNPANNAYIIPCNGMVGSSSTNCVAAIGMYYNTTSSKYCVAQQTVAGLTEYALTDLTVQKDVVRTIALNNVLRPSMKEYDTRLSLAGTQESSANIHWTLLKTPMPNGKFLYKWTGHYSQTKSVAITTGYGSNFMSGKFALAVPNSKIITNAIISARQSGSTAWIAGSYGGTTLDFYILRSTSATVNNTLEINIQAEYIDA